MRITSILILFIVLPLGNLWSQFSTVVYNPDRNTFGEQQPLPAETAILFTGPIEQQTRRVEVSIYPPKGNQSREPLALAEWQQNTLGSGAAVFHAPLNNPLRAGKKYDIEMVYFADLSSSEIQALWERLEQVVATKLAASSAWKGQQLKWVDKPTKIIRELDELLLSVLVDYRSENGTLIVQLPELIPLQMETMAAAVPASSEKEGTPASPKTNADLADLQKLIILELREQLPATVLKVHYQRLLNDYPTEVRPGYFALNAGYGAYFLGKSETAIDYGSGAYLGLSFPLSTSSIAPRFLRNAAISTGVFLQTYTTKNETQYSGPVLDRPIFIGLDYKLFQFVRFNFGGTLLERTKAFGTNESKTSLLFKPFIGLSARVNISLGLDQ